MPSSRLSRRLLALAAGAVAVAALAAPAAQAHPRGRADAAPSAPRGLSVDDQTRPLAVQGTPQFGWLPQDRDPDEVQTGYQLRVRNERGTVVWDSGKVASSAESWVPYAGPQLAPGSSYRWAVRTWDRAGKSSPFAGGRFDTGLGDQDWSGAQWIRRATSGNDASNDYTLARRTLNVSSGSPVVRARAYVAAMGDWAVHVNGRTVDKTSSRGYPGEGYYDVSDLTPLARAGRPLAVGVLYHYQSCTCQGRANGPVAPEGPSGLLVKVVVEHADGHQDVLVSDGSWRVAQDAAEQTSTLTWRNSDAGDRVEYVDARRALAGWDEPGYDDTGWSAPVVVGAHPRPAADCSSYKGGSAPCTFTHLVAEQAHVVTRVIHPTRLLHLPDGTVFADFGKVYSAVPSVRLAHGTSGRQLTFTTSYRESNTTSTAATPRGATRVPLASTANLHPGDRITVDAPADGYGAGHPETRTVAALDGTTAVLDAALRRPHDSGVWVENSRAGTSKLDTQGSDLHFYYTETAGRQTAQPFTYWAWRYLQLSDPGEQLSRNDISAVTQTTDVPRRHAATFASSNRTLNRVFGLMQRSALLTAQDTFLDTPTREKGQFLGDSVDESLATMSSLDERLLTREAIVDFVHSQDRYWPNGAMNAVYPNGDGKRDIPDYTEMFPEWVLSYYRETGDTGLLRQAYPAMRRIAEYIASAVDATGLVYELPGGSGPYQFGIIDWPAPMRYDTVRDGNGAETVVNALAVGADRAVAAAADALGEAADSAGYRDRADRIAAAMNRQLYNPDVSRYSDGLATDTRARIDSYSQHAQSYAVNYGIAPRSTYRQLGTAIARDGMHQGPMDLRQLEAALAETGQDAALVRLLTDPSQDGPAKILAEGGTALWEQWDPGCATSSCSGSAVDQTSSDSFSHGWGSAGIVQILRSLLGVSETGVGGSRVVIDPPSAGLASAAGTVWTERGPVTVAWHRSGRTLTAWVDVPVNVTAVVMIGSHPVHVGSGRHVVTGR